MTNPAWVLRTGRLLMAPVGAGDLRELTALKADPRVFAIMLGGVRTACRTAEELADDIAFWGARGFGMWSVRDRTTSRFLGVAGLMERPDGRGVALRFALWTEAQGRGLASEAAITALRFGHERARLERIIAVARETNFGSRTLLGGIGMWECDAFEQAGHLMIVYESLAPADPDRGNFLPL